MTRYEPRIHLRRMIKPRRQRHMTKNNLRDLRIRAALLLPIWDALVHRERTRWGAQTEHILKSRPDLQRELDSRISGQRHLLGILGSSDRSLDLNSRVAWSVILELEDRSATAIRCGLLDSVCPARTGAPR